MGELRTLPVVGDASPCVGCGACCEHMVRPPFYGDGDPSWDRLRRERPDLAAGIEADRDARPLTVEEEFGEGWPCLWYDSVTRLCRHHEYRPDVCADFEPGGRYCIDARESRGIGPPHPQLREGADPDD